MRLTPWKIVGLAAGAVAFILLVAIPSPLRHFGGFGSRPALAAAVTAMMAIWWLTEALPIYLTACVPLVMYPLLRVFPGGVGANARDAALPYVDAYIFLFAGGMCIAAAMQQWNLHRRIALTIMRLIGTDPKRLLFGFLCSTAFISLWISNTATAAMMVPIGIAVIVQFESTMKGRRLEHYGCAIMMGIAYASNVGGIGTKIGTAPNSQFCGFIAKDGIDITFVKFLAIGLPFVVLFLPVVWFALWRVGRHDAPDKEVGERAVAAEIGKLGATRLGEWVVLAVFIVTAALWVVGKPITDALTPLITAFKLKGAHVEGATAMLAALVLLAVRVEGRQALELRSLRLVPWETLVLLGGGFSMAYGIEQSGLSVWMGQRLEVIRGMSPFVQILVASVATVGLTAVASNTATIGVMLPVLKSAVPGANLVTVLFTATIAASCDFALPAGTPPNAIVFGSGYVSIPRMAKTGVLLDLAAALVAAAWCWIAVRWVI